MPTTVKTPKRFERKPLLGGLGSSAKQPLIASPKKNQPPPRPYSPPKPPTKIAPAKPRKLLALDTETTGVDLWHGCKPFFVSVMDENGTLQWWEWDVDPLTREVIVPPTDVAALRQLVTDNDLLLHNTKFDVHALSTHGIEGVNWEGVHDTLVASHVLVSNEPHGLKPLAMQYLDVRDDDQKALQNATNDARRMARSLGWRIANDGDPHFPAQQRPKDGWWVCDTWLPKAVAKHMWENHISDNPKLLQKGKKLSKREATQQAEALQWRPPGTQGPDDPGHPWWTVLKTYALRDVERTYGLWFIFKSELQEQHLYEIYDERRQLLGAIYDMECNAATFSVARRDAMVARLEKEAATAESICVKAAKSAGVKIDKSTLNSPKQLRYLLYGVWKLQPGKQTAGGDYSTDAETLAKLLNRSKGKPHEFITNLRKLRKCERTIAYLNEYTLRSVPRLSVDASTSIGGDSSFGHHVSKNAKPPRQGDHKTTNPPQQPRRRGERTGGTGISSRGAVKQDQPQHQPKPQYRSNRSGATVTAEDVNAFLDLHFNFNITGTDTTRFSSSQPNGQNIGKQVNELGDFNLRRIFGPRPGFVWYSIDYSNIELRIFVWKSGDQKLITTFEQGYKVHCVFSEVLYPAEWSVAHKKALAQAKGKFGTKYTEMELWGLTADIFKTDYESTCYQWTKNGNFALIYGAGRGKADSTYHVDGAYDLIRHRLPLIDDFLQLKQHEAKVHGFVRCEGGLVSPKEYEPNYRPGYRLFVPENEPHVAVNYYIQGTAGWCMTRAINRVNRYLHKLNATLWLTGSNRYRMIMTIHDELVFDFPVHDRNHRVISDIARLMEESGDDIGVPTPVEIEAHPNNWAEGEKIKPLTIAA